MAINPIARPEIPPLENGDRLTREEFHRRYLAMPENVRAELIDGQVYIGAEFPADTQFRDRDVPLLENGDSLSQEEFHRRYLAMPPQMHAELIDGVVYLASPVKLRAHGRPHAAIIGWLMAFESSRRDVELGDNTTILLEGGNEPQPDALLRYIEGRTTVNEEGYVVGAPELVAEVAASSVSFDMNRKLEMYARNGAQEYLVWRTRDAAFDWFVLRDGKYERLEPGDNGVIRSGVFPGLQLNIQALLAGDFAAVMTEQLAANAKA